MEKIMSYYDDPLEYVSPLDIDIYGGARELSRMKLGATAMMSKMAGASKKRTPKKKAPPVEDDEEEEEKPKKKSKKQEKMAKKEKKKKQIEEEEEEEEEEEDHELYDPNEPDSFFRMMFETYKGGVVWFESTLFAYGGAALPSLKVISNYINRKQSWVLATFLLAIKIAMVVFLIYVLMTIGFYLRVCYIIIVGSENSDAIQLMFDNRTDKQEHIRAAKFAEDNESTVIPWILYYLTWIIAKISPNTGYIIRYLFAVLLQTTMFALGLVQYLIGAQSSITGFLYGGSYKRP